MVTSGRGNEGKSRLVYFVANFVEFFEFLNCNFVEFFEFLYYLDPTEVNRLL